MNYLVDFDADSISLRLIFEAEQFTTHSGVVTLQRLPMALPFARKAADLSELGGGGLQTVYVAQRVHVTPGEFDAFACRLCADAPAWLAQARDALPAFGVAGGAVCVMVAAEGRPILFIDFQGYSYARYVARLG